MKRSERYRQMAQDMIGFRDAYQEVLDLTESKQDFLMQVRNPKPSKERELAAAKIKTARLAGRAQRAQKESGLSVSFSSQGGQVRLDPVVAWEHSLRDGEAMPPDALLAQLSLMAGALESKTEDAEYNERSLAGRVAAFVGFPVRVRALIAEEHPGLGGLGKVGLTAGIFVQIFVASVGGLVPIVATAGVTALWKNVLHSSPAPAKFQ